MKKFVLIFAAFCLSLILRAEEITPEIFPTTAAVGERVEYTITLPQRINDPPLPELSGAKWRRNEKIQGESTVNFKTSYSYTFVLVPEKAGELTIPAWEVKTSKGTFTFPECKIMVSPAGERKITRDESGITLAEAAQGSIQLAEPRSFCYVGEEIPIHVYVYLNRQVPFRQYNYPQLSGDQKLLFHDYSAVNRENRHFGRVQQTTVNKDGKSFLQLLFPAAVKPTAPGKLTLSGTVQLGVEEVRRRNRRDPFFDDFFSSFDSARLRPVTLELTPLPPLEVKPLPPAPAGEVFTGLIGNWLVKFDLDRKDVRVGEAVTFTISAVGTGSTEGIRAPEFTLPDVRLYPPETVRAESGSMRKIEFKYAMIPLKPGKLVPRCTFSVFDTVNGKYQTYSPDVALEVLPALVKAPQSAVFDTAPADSKKTETSVEKTPEIREELFYQRSAAGTPVKLPLWKNKLFALILLLIVIPGTALGCVLWRNRKKDPEKELRQKELERIANALKQNLYRPEELERLLRSDVASFLSPGATPAEIAENLEDDELKEAFEKCGQNSFMPGIESSGISLSPAALRKLLKILKAALVYAVAFLPLYGDDFNAAFDKGDYDKAIAQYEKYITPEKVSVNMLYNLGNACFRQGNLPLARYCLLKAHLLAPRDHEIKGNLDIVNRKLLQEEPQSSFGAEMLNQFRPDDYLLLAAVCIAVAVLAWAFKRELGKIAMLWIPAAAIFLFAAAVTAIIMQHNGAYSPDRGILIGREIPLKTLPADGAGHVEVTLSGGTEARIIETRDKWVRISANGKDGWISKDAVRRLDVTLL